jgi:hypothetical protein
VVTLPRRSGASIHPYTKKIRPITFDHEIIDGRDDVVLVHLNHPLVQMSLRLLRAEIWARDDVKRLNRTTVRSLPSDRLEGPAVAVASRLVVTGGTHHRLHEELTEAGGYLREAGFRREERVTEVRGWLKDSRPAAISESTFEALRHRFERQREAVLGAVEARSKDRLRFLANTIEARRRRETNDFRNVLDELEVALSAEIATEREPQQLSLFSEDERLQLRRDRAALQARLDRIPRERELEIRAIEDRYSHTKDHTFPVAVIFLVPDSLATEQRR